MSKPGAPDMGRKKKIDVMFKDENQKAPSPQSVEPLTPEEEAQAQAEEEALIQTGEWLTEFQARFTDQPVKIQVEKFDEAGDWALCRKYPLANFDPDAVHIEYGGGKYRCTLYDPQGRWIKGGRTYFKFAESIIKPGVSVKVENPLENPIVAMMLSAQKQNSDMLMGLMQTMLTAQGAGGSKPAGLGEMVEVVKSINSMTPKDKPMEAFKETLGLMKLVKEVTGDSDGEGKGGLLSDLKDVIEVLPLLKEHIATLKPQGEPVPGALTPGKPAELDPLSKKIIEMVPKFVGGARSNAPVSEWGAYLLNIFDVEILPVLLPVLKEKYKALVKDEDDAYDIVIRFAKDPSERNEALKQIPPLLPYVSWVNLVIDEALRLAETDEAPAPETASSGSAILDAVAANGDKKD